MIDLSSSTEPRIGVAAHVLREIGQVAARHSVPLMVVGATARDILSEAIIGVPPARATADVDVAVAVASWQAFEALAADLPRVGSSPHRFRVAGVQLDVVPFGEVEADGRVVDWGDGTRMSALGLREAFAHAVPARLPGAVEVLVPTVAGLVALKIAAWSDRRLETRRDAVDLQTMLSWYTDGDLLQEVYEGDLGLLAAYDFDPALASCHRLGVQMAQLLGVTAPAVAALVDDDRLGRLAADMPRSVLDQASLLRALRAGLVHGLTG